MEPLHHIPELKVKLQYGKFDYNTASELLTELKELGEAASPLVPILVRRLADGSLPCDSSSAVAIYLSTGNPELLEFIRSPQFWSQVGLDQRCQLFSGGVLDLEPELLTWLMQKFADPGEPMRRYVLESLSLHGSQEALEVLAHVDSQLSAEISERSAAAYSEDETGGALDPFARPKLASQQEFVKLVRETVEHIKSRVG